jgi:hypothetical protein
MSTTTLAVLLREIAAAIAVCGFAWSIIAVAHTWGLQ